jgi:NADH:ubiquinone oxidoreductase subunit 3 (subunit A)
LFFLSVGLERQSGFDAIQGMTRAPLDIRYESGFDAIKGMTKTPFDVKYYQVIIAFLFFDIDVSLFFPFVSLAGTSIITSVEICVAIISTIIFFVGLIYDLTNGLVDYAKAKNPKQFFSPFRANPYHNHFQSRAYSTKVNPNSGKPETDSGKVENITKNPTKNNAINK